MRYILFFVSLLFSFSSIGQVNSIGKDSATVDALLDESKKFINSDSLQAVNLSRQAITIAKELRYLKGEALGLKNIGLVHYMKGQYAETLNFWNQSLEVFQELGDKSGEANMFNNIGAIYLNQGADDKALENCLKSLQIAERINDTLRIISASMNVGSIYHNKMDPVAIGYLTKILPMVEASGDNEALVVLAGNIGEIYFDQKNDSKALEYYEKSIKIAGDEFSSAYSINGTGKIFLRKEEYDLALAEHSKAYNMAERFEDKLQIIRSLRGTADVYVALGKTTTAIDYYNRARILAESMDDVNIELKDLYGEMAAAYSKQNDFTNAYKFQQLYSNIQDTLYNIESKKKLNKLQFDFELSKKEVEISLQNEKIKTEKQARTATTVGLGLILIIAVIIYRNYLQKSRTNQMLDKQKDEIEGLLLNILPKEVAEELKDQGVSVPRHYEEVSVLFTDFYGFTAIADTMSPDDLVNELNQCFIAFDSIVEKYGLEKIKTIGDSYMCAGNLPSENPDHVYKIIKAGMEMQDFLKGYNDRWISKGMLGWDIRIGVHVGPVVAGVVGKTKYAYDIWGSTVNIASRMETSGSPGRVNISEKTYDIIKDRFECSHRGKVHAKNLGDISMYFIEFEKENQEENSKR